MFATMMMMVTFTANAKIGGGQKVTNSTTTSASYTYTASTSAPSMASTYSAPQSSNSARTNESANATKKVTVPVAGYVAKCNVEVGYMILWISPTRPNGALGKVGSHLIKKYKVMYEFSVSDAPALGDFVTFKYDANSGYAYDYSNPSKSGREAAAAVHDDPLGAVIDGVGAIFGGIFR